MRGNGHWAYLGQKGKPPIHSAGISVFTKPLPKRFKIGEKRGKAITCTGLRVLGRIRKRSSYDKSRDSRRTDAIVLRVHGVMLYSVYCFSRDVLLKTKRYLANSIMDNFCFQCTVIFEHPVPTASNCTNREN